MTISPRRVSRKIAVALLLAMTACGVPNINSLQMASTPATPEPELSWAVVDIPKQTLTATPMPMVSPPDDAVLREQVYPTPEAAQGPLITMEIIEDVALPEPEDQTEAPVAVEGKYILVRIGEQHLYAYENGALIYDFVASTGMRNSTRVGTFQVLDKIPNAYGSTWDIWMPNWMGIYWSGSLENGIHALPILPGGGRLWSGYLGTPISYGCVVLGADEAVLLYDWAEVGTTVEIRW